MPTSQTPQTPCTECGGVILPHCRGLCRNCYQRNWSRTNPAKTAKQRTRTKKRLQEDPGLRERYAKTKQQYTKRRPEVARAAAKKFRETHKEQRRREAREYAAANPEKIRANKKRYHERHSEKVKQASVAWARKTNANLTRNRKAYLRRYGLTPESYEQMILSQDNKCAICEKRETAANYKTGKVWALAIDHDHTTGHTRALLCHRCNLFLGAAEDSVELLSSAIRYLEKHSATGHKDSENT
jgi:hypothetical protein